MKEKKAFLREKFIEFQKNIFSLKHLVKTQEETFISKEKGIYLELFEVLDAFENLDETLKAKEEGFDKTTRMLAKNIRSIHKKTMRVLKKRNIEQITFPDKRANMEYCKIIDTQESDNLEDETILSVVKNGYIDTERRVVLRKADVITSVKTRE